MKEARDEVTVTILGKEFLVGGLNGILFLAIGVLLAVAWFGNPLLGALFGAAAALKYSNAIFGLAAFPLAAFMPGAHGAARWRSCLGYVAGGVAALAALAVYVLEQVQRQRTGAVEQQHVALLRVVEVGRRDVGDQREHFVEVIVCAAEQHALA